MIAAVAMTGGCEPFAIRSTVAGGALGPLPACLTGFRDEVGEVGTRSGKTYAQIGHVPSDVFDLGGAEAYLTVRRDLAHRPQGRSRRRREAPKDQRALEHPEKGKRRRVLCIADRSR